ncbi:MAG: hypothetical protein A3C88_02380 [Candidatus Yanofskybacteria bacterium RIFCSPHIGHO2_02_FULL_50_12]|uniref:Uncharacterized protein n=1 Tax=Candidatus Yanofskybacteria bacterium RIFCSPHIGHO2_02_FULL_50_12 TaxID=1802685 RepID=A0A1F8FZ75_9BACT|nr:MAG: hypothetical protein A3C88_02380 [Candidatus Yanofskybacteria bacterium RIFCSPHIGHO2_02_FULL_50_12]
MLFDDGVYPVFEGVRLRRANFDYPCAECHVLIPKGTRHYYIVWKNISDDKQDRPHEVRICCDCHLDWENFTALFEALVGEEAGCSYGFLKDELQSALEDPRFTPNHPLIAKLIKTWLPEPPAYRPTEADGQPYLPFEELIQPAA